MWNYMHMHMYMYMLCCCTCHAHMYDMCLRVRVCVGAETGGDGGFALKLRLMCCTECPAFWAEYS